MAKTTFVLGLCGSGKTFLANLLKKETGAEIFEAVAGQHNPNGLTDMLNRLQKGMDCIVDEIAYCCPRRRDAFVIFLRSKIPEVEIDWICFENDLESADWNVKHRPDPDKEDVQGHLEINRNYHRLYSYPDGATIKPIRRIDQSGLIVQLGA